MWVTHSATGRPTVDNSRTRTSYACRRCGLGLFGLFSLSYYISSGGLKYCLKVLLNQDNQLATLYIIPNYICTNQWHNFRVKDRVVFALLRCTEKLWENFCFCQSWPYRLKGLFHPLTQWTFDVVTRSTQRSNVIVVWTTLGSCCNNVECSLGTSRHMTSRWRCTDINAMWWQLARYGLKDDVLLNECKISEREINLDINQESLHCK